MQIDHIVLRLAKIILKVQQPKVIINPDNNTNGLILSKSNMIGTTEKPKTT